MPGFGTRSPAGDIDEMLTSQELRDAFVLTASLRPALEQELDFELECCKEVLVFLQSLWADSKRHAVVLAIIISTLVSWRACGRAMDFEDFPYKDNLRFNPNAGPCPMLQKIQKEKMSKKMIQMKVLECRSSLTWLEPIVRGMRDTGRVSVCFDGAYTLIADSLNHLTCYLLSVELEDGKLYLP